jgi:hypothetical protein
MLLSAYTLIIVKTCTSEIKMDSSDNTKIKLNNRMKVSAKEINYPYDDVIKASLKLV